MPRVTRVEKCRHSPGQCGKCSTKIKKGEPYLWWKFRTGGRGGSKHVRCAKPECAPKASDLTQSEFWGEIYAMQEQGITGDTFSDLKDSRDEVANRLTEMADELEEKRNNMPEGLQDGETGNMLQERADACRDAATELENQEIPDDPDWSYTDGPAAGEITVKKDGELFGYIIETSTKAARGKEKRWQWAGLYDEGKREEPGKEMFSTLEACKSDIEKDPTDDSGQTVDDIRGELEGHLELSCS